MRAILVNRSQFSGRIRQAKEGRRTGEKRREERNRKGSDALIHNCRAAVLLCEGLRGTAEDVHDFRCHEAEARREERKKEAQKH